jgi:hypothetical protein
VVKQRWLFCILVLILFVISANIGITALLLYYINVTNVSKAARLLVWTALTTTTLALWYICRLCR